MSRSWAAVMAKELQNRQQEARKMRMRGSGLHETSKTKKMWLLLLVVLLMRTMMRRMAELVLQEHSPAREEVRHS